MRVIVDHAKIAITWQFGHSYREIVTSPHYNATEMADLQNSLTRSLIIVFIQLFSAYRQSATLELLVRNSR